jgi:tRNA(Ile)-lysidine synthase TilS/MesJ
MVCLFIANAVFGNKNVRCVSIDYANRPEQSLEIQMVNHVCGILEIEHYVRVIDEVKRPLRAPKVEPRDGLIDREFYESFTRDIRFKAYRDVASDTFTSIILGHNLDDTLENVFSNMKKHKNYDNLFGMTQWSEERGVQIWRPLLEVPKSDIIDFALRYRIPFTYDSTPAWSERGQLRDRVIPALTEYIPGLITMVKNMKQMYKQQRNACIQNIIFNDNVTQVTNHVYSLEYFQQTFKQIALHYKVPYPKNKSLIHLMEQMQRSNSSRLTVSVHFVAQLFENGFSVFLS